MSSISFNIPQRNNYTFLGYFTEGEGGGTCYYDSNGVGIGMAAFKSDVTLFAHWQGNNVTIALNNEGGTGTDEVIAVYGSMLPDVRPPS